MEPHRGDPVENAHHEQSGPSWRESLEDRRWDRAIWVVCAWPFAATAMFFVYAPVGVAMAAVFGLMVIGVWSWGIWVLVSELVDAIRKRWRRTPKEKPRKEQPRHP
jgi:hypothetical protein